MINVVAAIIKNKNDQILIAQRNLKKSQGGLWEFPGGKIEKGETQEQAIIREIKEELDMDIKIDSYYDEKIYEYPEKTIKLIALKCTMVQNKYNVLEHENIKWNKIEEFDNYNFAPADIYFVEKIKKECT